MEATTIGGVVRKCGERLFRHVETSQGTKEVTNQFVTYCKVKGITVPKDPKGDYAFKQFVRKEFEAASKQVTNEKEPFKELMASNHTALMLQFREVLIKDCKAFGWENIANVRVCGMQGATMARNG
ncbi:hypothetical protein HaLaN_07291, partial [Haematococcus lacustris]